MVFISFFLSSFLSFFPLLFLSIFTGRNEVVAKVMFLHVSVILSTGGGGVLQAGRTSPPGWERRTPPGPGRPPRLGDPPGPGRTPPGWETPPRTRQNPPGTRQTPPPGKQTSEYGLRAAGTHPTGMHSCSFFLSFFFQSLFLFIYL